MATVRETAQGNQDIAAFQLLIQQQEGIMGPLISLWSEPPLNVMTFGVGPSPDADHRTILATYTDHPPAKDGFFLFCAGSCLIDGSVQQVAAYRKTS